MNKRRGGITFHYWGKRHRVSKLVQLSSFVIFPAATVGTLAKTTIPTLLFHKVSSLKMKRLSLQQGLNSLDLSTAPKLYARDMF